MTRPDFPRARAMLDPPGPSDGAIWTVILGLVAIHAVLFKAARKLLRSSE